MKSLSLVTAALALCLTATVTRPVMAEYPEKPIQLVVPFAAGTAPDVLGRLLADHWSRSMKATVVVRNMPGAGGNIGVEHVAKAAPDGYTVVLAGDAAIVVSPALYANLPYAPQRDLAPISQVAITPNVLVVAPKHDVRDVAGLVKLARGQEKPLAYASAGNGTSGHRAGAMLARAAGIELTHVPYKASPMPDVIGNVVDLFFANPANAMPLIREGKVRALAVTAPKRLAAAPDVPTMLEAGFQDFVVASWFGLFAPAGTPDAILKRLHEATAAALADEAMRSRLATLGAEPVGNSPASFARVIATETPRWAAVLKDAGITAN